MERGQFFAELKRRNVYKVAVAYAVVAWLLIQAGSIIFPTFEAPPWVMKILIIILAVGFIIALVISWAFEMTPQGMKRTDEISPNERLPYWSGRKFVAVIASIALLAGALYFFQRFRPPPASPSVSVASSSSLDVISEKSIAVLPFENLSRDPDNAYFANGIQDEILTRLAKIEDLKVISRTSTQRYKSSSGNLPAIAKELGVAHILEGSVQKSADQVRVTVQLVRALSDAHVWAETYDRKLTDIFAVESDVAENIARALRAKLTPQEQRAVTARPTENPAAYEAYLRGLALWNKLTAAPQNLLDIATHLSRAVELDPKFVVAWSLLSVTHTLVYAEAERTPERAAQAKEALERAQKLEPDNGDVHFAEGMYRYRVLRAYDDALASFQKARVGSSNRTFAIEFSAYVKRRQGKWDDALRLHDESLDIDPRNPILLSEAAVTNRAVRRFPETNALLDRAREVEPENPALLVQEIEAALAQGELEKAGRFFGPVPLDSGQPTVISARYNYYLFTRKPAEAAAMLRKLLETQVSPREAPHYRAELGVAEALAGNDAVAQTELTRARDELLALRVTGDSSERIGNNLVRIFGFLGDKESVEREAALMREEIATDALIGPLLETTVAAARAHLGQTDAAMEMLTRLLSKPGEEALTPALLRADPRWDPLRSDARFQKLCEGK